MAISHFADFNAILEIYCNGIKANSDNYCFVDYWDLYVQKGKKEFEKTIEAMVIENRVNYIFFILWSSDLTFDIHFLEKLSKSSSIVMNFFDTEYYFESVDRYYAQLADLVLLPNYLPKYAYELLNINTLCTFSLFSKKLYAAPGVTRKTIDVSFVGNFINRTRRKHVDYLMENNISIEAYGADAPNGHVSFARMLEIFSESRINLNFTGTDQGSAPFGLHINNRIKGCKGRPIEVALCGGFVLSEYAPGIEEMFEIGKEIDVFHTQEELKDKIKYYLENEEEREEIARRGHERALRDYDAETAFGRIFGTLHKYRRKDPALYVDKCFVRGYSSFRFHYMGLFLLAGKYRNFLEELCLFLKYRKIDYPSVRIYLRYIAAVWLGRHKTIKDILRKILRIPERR